MNTNAELALPEPETTTLAQVRTDLVPRVRAIRERIQETGDIEAAQELARQLGAYHRYLSDKDGKYIVAAETRRTELLIGQLLGPGESGRPAKTSHASEVSIAKDDRYRFRLLAENAAAVEAAIESGIVTRKALLEHISFRPGASMPLADGKCTTLIADPPWQYGNTATRASAQGHYDTLTIAQLCGDDLLPDGTNLVKDVIEPKSANPGHLYLWTTAGHLPQAFQVMEAWGYAYKTYLVWVKPQMGMGNYFRVSTELVLFGIRGGMRTRDMATMNYFTAKRGKHSAKPKDFYDLVAKSSPGQYLELFARCAKDGQLEGTCQCNRCSRGWEVWGNQA